MGPLALVILALAGWLWWTGKLKRLKANDGIAIVMGLVAAVTVAKGKPLLGALPALLTALYAFWRIRQPSTIGSPPKSSKADMSLEEARALLGIGAEADADTIRAAHRRLIVLTHPDRGGTEALARNINRARDVLLRHHAEKQMPHQGD